MGLGTITDNLYPYLYTVPSDIDLYTTNAQYVNQWWKIIIRAAKCPIIMTELPTMTVNNTLIKNAPHYFIEDMYSVIKIGQDAVESRLDIIKTVLMTYHNVIFVVPVHDSFVDPKITSQNIDYDPAMYPDKMGITGGHSMTIIGWTETAWIVRNSWGSKWGRQDDLGCIYMKFGTINEYNDQAEFYFVTPRLVNTS